MAGNVKYFVLQQNGKDSNHVFSGKQPRAAALKAAARGFKKIELRERGAKRIHIFEGTVKVVDAPPNAPSWMPAKVKKANVKKLGIKRLDK